MASKDLVIMCQFFYPEYITSALLPYQTATYLADKGKSVDVICGYPEEYIAEQVESIKKNETINGINIHRVKYLQLSRENKFLRLINYFSFVLAMLFQLPKIKRYKAIMVYSNPPILPIVAILSNMLLKTKIIFVCYDVYPEIAEKTNILNPNGIISRIMHIVNNQLFKRASSVVALSEDMKQFLVNNRNIESEKISVIPNWATEESEKSLNTKQASKSTSKPFTISYLGNMGIPQDLDTILNAIKQEKLKNNPNFQFVFAGHGNQKEKVENFIQVNDLNNVKVHGFLTGEKFDKMIADANAFLITLKEELLGLAVPSKFYTYLLQGKMMINIMSNNADISKEIKRHGLGITVANNEYVNLADKIFALANETPDYDNTSVYHEYYTKDIQLNKYDEVITKIVGGE